MVLQLLHLVLSYLNLYSTMGLQYAFMALFGCGAYRSFAAAQKKRIEERTKQSKPACWTQANETNKGEKCNA
jgi:hypothetical protein